MRVLATTLFMTCVSVFACAAESDGVLGVWVTEGGDARVEILKVGKTYAGKIVWLAEPDYPKGDAEAGRPKRDRENPDESKRGRAILGLEIMTGFEYAKDGRWTKGTIYDAESGKTYKSKLTLIDENTLDVRGFIGVSLIGRTTTWKRYVEPRGDK